MIVNQNVVSGGEQQKKYTVWSEGSNVFFPTEAYPGQYVITTDGVVYGSTTVYDRLGYYVICYPVQVHTADELPPKAREVLEGALQTRVGPAGTDGYFYFVMPEEDVKVQTI